MNQKLALALIIAGLLLAGWLDGRDAELTEKSVQLACISCGPQK